MRPRREFRQIAARWMAQLEQVNAIGDLFGAGNAQSHVGFDDFGRHAAILKGPKKRHQGSSKGGGRINGNATLGRLDSIPGC
jgi:hypothetical protein